MIPSGLGQLLGLALPCGIAVGVVVLLWRRRRARGELARLARRVGLNYQPHDSHGLRGRLAGLELLSQGHNRCLGEIVCGSNRQGPLYCFRYRYERGRGVDRVTFRWVVAAIEVERVVGEQYLRVGELPDAVLESRRGELASLPRMEEWSASLDFAVALECRGHVISLQAVDDGTDGQYEAMLAAIEEVGLLIAPQS